MPPAKKYKNFEKAIDRLEEITADLEGREVSLEEAIKLYTEGLEIAKLCTEKLDKAEKQILLITEKEGVVSEGNFEEDDDED